MSLTVNLKFKVLDTELNASMFATASPPGKTGVTFKPARIVDNFGKVLVGKTEAGNDNQFGPVVLVGDATLPEPDVVEFVKIQLVLLEEFLEKAVVATIFTAVRD